MRNVGEWLSELGLSQYEPAFRENDIDAEVVIGLTADDLRELGVVSIGHRRRLLDAIAALKGIAAAAPLDRAPTSVVADGLAAPPEAERRQLTVMPFVARAPQPSGWATLPGAVACVPSCGCAGA